ARWNPIPPGEVLAALRRASEWPRDHQRVEPALTPTTWGQYPARPPTPMPRRPLASIESAFAVRAWAGQEGWRTKGSSPVAVASRLDLVRLTIEPRIRPRHSSSKGAGNRGRRGDGKQQPGLEGSCSQVMRW